MPDRTITPHQADQLRTAACRLSNTIGAALSLACAAANQADHLANLLDLLGLPPERSDPPVPVPVPGHACAGLDDDPDADPDLGVESLRLDLAATAAAMAAPHPALDGDGRRPTDDEIDEAALDAAFTDTILAAIDDAHDARTGHIGVRPCS